MVEIVVTENTERLAEIRDLLERSPIPSDYWLQYKKDVMWLLELVDKQQEQVYNLAVSEAAFNILVERLQERVRKLEEEPCPDCHYGACWEYCRCEEFKLW